MDPAPESFPNHHGPNRPNRSICLPMLEQQRQQHQLHHPPATLPSRPLYPMLSTSSCAHFPASQPITNGYHEIHDASRLHETHGANYGNVQPTYIQSYNQSSNSQQHGICVPFESQVQLNSACPAEQNTRESAAASISSRKCKSASAKNTQSRKRQRVPVAPTTEPPSSICGVGPPTIVQSSSPPSTPVRPSSAATAASVSASFRLPTHNRHSTEAAEQPESASAAATDVWYFCRPQDSSTSSSEQTAPDNDPVLTQRPQSKYISCKLCL